MSFADNQLFQALLQRCGLPTPEVGQTKPSTARIKVIPKAARG
jgi:hypothetical protein